MRKLIQTTAVAALSLFMLVPQATAQIADDEMFAPLPAAANGPAIDQSVGYLVQELGRGLYVVSDGIYQMKFLTTGEGVIVVDAPPFMGQKILPAIASVTDELVTHVIIATPTKTISGLRRSIPKTPSLSRTKTPPRIWWPRATRCDRFRRKVFRTP